MDDLDRDLLRFAATHRVVSSDQLAVLAGAENHDEPAARTGRLVGEGLLSPLRLIATGPDCLVITEAGLAAIGSRLSVPAWEMRGLRQALAAGWVSVRAQDGRFADLTGGVLARRELEAHDSELMSAGPRPSGSAPYGIRVSGVSSAHVSGLHHPDLLLQFRAGWVAVEIVLGAVTPPGLAAL